MPGKRTHKPSSYERGYAAKRRQKRLHKKPVNAGGARIMHSLMGRQVNKRKKRPTRK